MKSLWNTVVSKDTGRTFSNDRAWYKYAKALVKGITISQQPVLDLGCGRGEFSFLLRQLGGQVTACDGDSVTLSMLTEKEPPFRVSEVNLESPLPFADHSFHCVVLLEVIEHISLAEQLLLEIRRVLVPGGYLLLSTPNFAWFVWRIRHLWGGYPPNEGVHVRFFTRKKLETVLHESGFDIIGRRSYTVVICLNRFLRLLGARETLNVYVPPLLESLFAQDFVWLLQSQATHN